MNQRPFFSIVVACYNSRLTIGTLLESILNQELDKEDYEVIISDDCSTEPYDDILAEYADKMNMKKVVTDYNCCPGNTRQRGLENVSGRWICFSDHDDEFVPGSLKKLKDLMENEYKYEQYYLVTGFIKRNSFSFNSDDEPLSASQTGAWTHGKFYNYDNLIKPYNIRYKQDLKSNEDIYFNTKVKCVIATLQAKYADAGRFVEDLYTYIWNNHPGSQSHSMSEDGNHTFFERTFLDFAQATGEAYLEEFYKGQMPWAMTRELIKNIFIVYYFYSTSFLYFNPNHYSQYVFPYLTQFFNRVKSEFAITNKEVWAYVTADYCTNYETTRAMCEGGTGVFPPSLTFVQWLEAICPDAEPIQDALFYITPKEGNQNGKDKSERESNTNTGQSKAGSPCSLFRT